MAILSGELLFGGMVIEGTVRGSTSWCSSPQQPPFISLSMSVMGASVVALAGGTWSVSSRWELVTTTSREAELCPTSVAGWLASTVLALFQEQCSKGVLSLQDQDKQAASLVAAIIKENEEILEGKLGAYSSSSSSSRRVMSQ